MAPAGTPGDIVHRLASEVVRAMSEAGFAEHLADLGVEPHGTGPEEFAEIIAADLHFWTGAVKTL